MMKRFFIAALTLAATIPAAINLQAQDDDIYFSKKADKKAKHEAIYAATADNEWSTNANNDWNLDDYNRRGKESSSALSDGIEIAEDAPFYYNIINEKGDTVLVPGTDKILKGADVNGYKIVRDTVVLVEQYRFTDLIRRFHNPFFGYYRYSPWYDVAYYDPFYWDYCYYDPWWYVTPSFGFHWGSWYGGWSYGYYSGWYGGWYSPFYCPNPHYYHYCDYYYDGPVYNYATGGSHRGSSRNNFGGHFAHRGGWKGDGGSVSRMASASTNRSYRAENGARVGFTNSNGTYTAGPTLRGRNTVNGRLANSNMRSSTSEYNRSATTLGASRGGDVNASANSGSYSSRRHTATRYDRAQDAATNVYSRSGGGTATASRGNSGSASTTRSGEGNTRTRRGSVISSNRGFSYDNSASRRAANTYTPSSPSYDRSSYSRSYDNGGNSSYSSSRSSYSNSNNSSTRSSYSSGSSSSYSSGSSYSGGGSSYSGGGSSHSSGGSHSSGSSHGRR